MKLKLDGYLYVQAALYGVFSLSPLNRTPGWTAVQLVLAVGAAALGATLARLGSNGRPAVIAFEIAAVALGALSLVSGHLMVGTATAVIVLIAVLNASGAQPVAPTAAWDGGAQTWGASAGALPGAPAAAAPVLPPQPSGRFDWPAPEATPANPFAPPPPLPVVSAVPAAAPAPFIEKPMVNDAATPAADVPAQAGPPAVVEPPAAPPLPVSMPAALTILPKL